MGTELHAVISQFIEKGQSVLDLGCGKGELLQRVTEEKEATGYGVELRSENIIDCIQKGLSVFQGDIDEGLKEFPDKSFDVAILSQTLQQVKQPLYVIEEMCRVARVAIVSFPNFAHWSCRWQLLRGVIPQSKSLPFEWYDTPNIRVVSIRSFEAVCEESQIEILHMEGLSGKEAKRVRLCPNLFADRAVFVIKKED